MNMHRLDDLILMAIMDVCDKAIAEIDVQPSTLRGELEIAAIESLWRWASLPGWIIRQYSRKEECSHVGKSASIFPDMLLKLRQ